MSGNLAGFDANEEPEHVPMDFAPLPVGEYDCVIVESEMKPTKKGDGEMLALTLEVIDGAFKGRKLFDNLNIHNPSEKCAKIARAKLSAICKAVNVVRPDDSQELHDRPLVVKVGMQTYNNELKNEVKGYLPRGKASPVASQKAGPPPTSATAVGNRTAPWGRPTAAPPASPEADDPF